MAKVQKGALSFKEKEYQKSPHCRSCRCLMLESGNLPNSVTIQHISPKGWSDYNTNKKLWCVSCNQNDALWKQNNRIYSLKECLHFIYTRNNQLNGWYIVDWTAYHFQEGKLTKQLDYIYFRLQVLSEWNKDKISGKTNKKYDEYFEHRIKGWCTLKAFYMGKGWYAFGSDPKLVEHWRYKTKEEIEEEEEGLWMLETMLSQIY